MPKMRKKYWRVFELKADTPELVNISAQNWYDSEEDAVASINDFEGTDAHNRDFLALPVYSFEID